MLVQTKKINKEEIVIHLLEDDIKRILIERLSIDNEFELTDKTFRKVYFKSIDRGDAGFKTECTVEMSNDL